MLRWLICPSPIFHYFSQFTFLSLTHTHIPPWQFLYDMMCECLSVTSSAVQWGKWWQNHDFIRSHALNDDAPQLLQHYVCTSEFYWDQTKTSIVITVKPISLNEQKSLSLFFFWQNTSKPAWEPHPYGENINKTWANKKINSQYLLMFESERNWIVLTSLPTEPMEM